MTLKELAAQLGLSPAAVSKALRDKDDISEETRQRVKAAAKKLGYVPNFQAQILRQGHTGFVVLLIPPMHEHNFHTASFFNQLDYGIEEVLLAHGYHSVLLVSRDEKEQMEKIKWLCSSAVADALIVTDTQLQDPRINYLKRNKFPFVCMGRTADTKGISFVDMNHEKMARDAVQYLLSSGYNKIAVEGIESTMSHSANFLSGYYEALEQNHLPVRNEYVIHAHKDTCGGEFAFQQLMALPDPPQAILFLNDLLMYGALHYARMHNLPQVKGLCAISSSSAFSFFDPAPVYFALDLVDIGRRLGEAVLDSVQQFKAHRLNSQGRSRFAFKPQQVLVDIPLKRYETTATEGQKIVR